MSAKTKKKKPRPIKPVLLPTGTEASLSIVQVQAALGNMSRYTLRRMIMDGDFPKPEFYMKANGDKTTGGMDGKRKGMPRWHQDTFNEWYRRNYRKIGS